MGGKRMFNNNIERVIKFITDISQRLMESIRMLKKKSKSKSSEIIKLISAGKLDLDEVLNSAGGNDVEDLFEIGVFYRQIYMLEVADKIFTRILQINPNLAKVWHNKGVTLGILGKNEEAIKCLEEAIKINPNYAEAWTDKGVLLGNLGRHQEAVKCFEEAIRINPNYAEAYLI
jgi:tetratricopeptide (TPR) repeat protein